MLQVLKKVIFHSGRRGPLHNLVRFSLCIPYAIERNTSTGQFVPRITGACNGSVIFWPALINTAFPGSAIRHVDGTIVPKAG